MRSLAGKVALVTGGSRGLGTSIARTLATEGAHLALTARSAEGLERVARELEGPTTRVVTIAGDLTDAGFQDGLVERVASELGPVDLLVNNAGIESIARFDRLPVAELDAILLTNLVAPLRLTRRVLPSMLARGSGHVVTMSSLGGLKGSPYSATYAATKAALIEWNRGLREELRTTGVTASVVCPGFVSEAGLFADLGRAAPRFVGTVSPEQVTDAVLRAIHRDEEQVIVSARPIVPMLLVDAVAPRLMTWVLRNVGVYRFYRDLAEINERARTKGE